MIFHDVSYRYGVDQLTVDIELTNKCNLHCDFCPREKIPATGWMTAETFRQVIHRAEESPLPYRLSSCGTGDSILHPDIAHFVARAASRSLPYRLTTSASLLDAAKSRALLDAGLTEIHFSVTGIHEQYSDTYGFPFDRTLRNILAFRELAEQQQGCEMRILIIQTAAVVQDMEIILDFWKRHGFKRKHLLLLEEHNRSGSYSLDRTRGRDVIVSGDIIASEPQLTGLGSGSGHCPIPFVTMFIGWDGHYYLCSNDWEKNVSLGNVFEHSFADIVRLKMDYLQQENIICLQCSYFPANYMTDIDSGDLQVPRQKRVTFLDNNVAHQHTIHSIIRGMHAD